MKLNDNVKMIRYTLGLAVALCLLSSLTAQDDSEVLFTVAGEPVTVGEFRYIYTKTNGPAADFSEESVREYLDLYERFKLKVARAREMGLDTVTSLQEELAGYRKQLADNYLIDRQVTDPLVEQLYERKKHDIDFSHILLRLPAGRNVDTAATFRRAKSIKDQLTAENFAEQARQLSQDQYSSKKGGRIGFVTAPFPRGLYALERTLYDAPEGQVVGPVRTAAGYHLAIKHATRPARGEVEIAHILLRKPAQEGGAAGQVAQQSAKGADDETARQLAKQAKAELDSGKPFEAVAAQYSQDDKTKNEGGYIGFFGINRYNPVFEEAAFALTEDGQVSEVIESPVGYHILRRISRRGVQPLREQRPLLETTVRGDDRFESARQEMIEQLKERLNVNEQKQNFGGYLATLDSSFFDPAWSPAAPRTNTTLVRIGDRPLGLADFQDYLTRNTRRRVSLSRNRNAVGAAEDLYRSWLDEAVMRYAESRLEEDFPDFRALMREYREGILLFEATKLEVWDRAGQDTVGLKAFFADNREDYRYGERAVVTKYTLSNKGELDVNAIAALAVDQNSDAVLNRFGREYLDAETFRYEADRLAEVVEGLEMKAGSQSAITNDLRKGVATFYQVEAIEPARTKELKEARGYVIADYQDQLEREWVADLRKRFPVKVNKKILAKLIES